MSSKIMEYLKSLGATSEQVAASLMQQGIKGNKRSCKDCPIINAIYKKFPEAWTGLKIVGGPIHYRATYNDSQIIDPQLTPAVDSFIHEFDCDKYPELELKN